MKISMGVFTKLNKSQIKSLLNNFPELPKFQFSYKGVAMGTVNTYYKITFANKKVYYLKIDEVGDEKRLKNEIQIFKNLHQEQKKLSYQCPFPLKTQNGSYYISYRHKFVLIFAEIPGKSIFVGLSPNYMYQIGQKLAELHKITVQKQVKHHRFNLKGLKKSFIQIKKQLYKQHPKITERINNELKNLSKNYPKKQKEVLIHADLFPENIHWQKKIFVGMIDFEAAGLGEPLFDVCVCIHALCHNGKKFDVKKIKALLKGYNKIRPLNKKEMNHFYFFMKLSCLRFLITRLKDFELPGVNPKTPNFKDYRDYKLRLDELNKIK